MKWFEYKQEVDSLHASDALKARLLAMQGTGIATEAAHDSEGSASPAARPLPPTPGAAAAPRKPRRPLPWRRIAALAACFAFGVIACDAFGWSVLPRMGSSYSMYAAKAEDNGEMAETYSADAAYDSAENAMADTTAGSAEGSAAATDWAGSTVLPTQRDTSRKIIYNASLSLESKDYTATLAALNDAVAAAGGYIEASDEYAYSGDTRSCSITCRIPAAAYADFLTAAADTGSLTNKSQSAQDITADYVDVAARIQALEAQRDRLLELEQQAGDLSDLLQIEDSLTNVQYQLESYQGQQKLYDDQVDFSTVTIDVEEVASYTPVQTGFWQRLGEAFSRALIEFGDTLAELVFWLAGLWPWLVLIAVVAGVICLVRKIRRKK